MRSARARTTQFNERRLVSWELQFTPEIDRLLEARCSNMAQAAASDASWIIDKYGVR